MPTKTDRILSYLPRTFLPDTRQSALRAIAAAAGNELQAGEVALARILQSHWVDSADRGAILIDDLARIASLYGLAPLRFPDGSQMETVEQFRAHLKRYVRSLLEGRVTVRGLIGVTADILGVSVAEGEQLDPWWNRRVNRVITQVARGEDAATLVFGEPAVDRRGVDAQPAILAGNADLSGGADLSAGSFLRLQVDEIGPHTVDLAAGADPSSVPLEAMRDAINNRFGADVASHDGQFLTIRSLVTGPEGRLELEEIRGDASLTVFGVAPHIYTGDDARAAALTSTVNIGGGVDLSHDRFLRIVLDGKQAAEVDCAGANPANTLLPEIQQAINEALGVDVASHENGLLQLTSPQTGSRSTLFLQTPAAQDAAARILGQPARFYLGSDAAPAVAVTTPDLSAGVDLSEASVLRIGVDGAPTLTINCAGADPSKTTVEEIANHLAAALGQGAASTDGRRVRLTSRASGRQGEIVFEQGGEGDALGRIFGFGPRVFHGAPELPASYTAIEDTSEGLNLLAASRLGLIVDGLPPREIQLPIEKGVTPDEAAAAINAQTGEDIAFSNGTQVILTSRTKGAASRIAIVPLETELRRRFLTRAAILDEASRTLLGYTARSSRGKKPVAAVLESLADIQFGVDLTTDRWLRIAIDSRPAVTVDCAGARPRNTTIDEAAAAIAGVEGVVVTHDGKRLTLRSLIEGAGSAIRFEPVRERDAAPVLIGFDPAPQRGEDAGRVIFTSTVDLSKGIDLAPDARVRIGVDAIAPADASLNNGLVPARKTLSEIVSAINLALGGSFASHDGRVLNIASAARGSASKVIFERPAGSDVTKALFGFETPRSYQASEATRATITGAKDLPETLDLSTRRFLRISVDGATALPVDCAATAVNNAERAALSRDKIVTAINNAIPGVAALKDGKLELHSPTFGSASRIAVEPHVSGDARQKILGAAPGETRGRGAQPAELVGDIALLEPVDLSDHRKLLIEIDAGRPVEIELGGEAPGETTLENAIEGINAILPGVASATTDRRLRLRSPSAGSASTIAVLARRHIELLEHPPAAASFNVGAVRNGDNIELRNAGVADSVVEVRIESTNGTAEPALVNETAGIALRFNGSLRARESIRLLQDPSSGVYGILERPGHAPQRVAASALQVIPTTDNSAGFGLEFPRGVANWRYLECLGPRFNEARFGEERFPGETCDRIGIFDVESAYADPDCRDAMPPDTHDCSVFAPDPLPAPTAAVSFAWLTYPGGSMEINLPAELPAAFGGRFNEARFGLGVERNEVGLAPKKKSIEGVFFEPDRNVAVALDPAYVVNAVNNIGPEAKVIEADDTRTNVPLGFVAHTIPFRPAHRLTGGSALDPARIFLRDPASSALIEFRAVEPGAWGNEIAVAVRPDGPGRYLIEVTFAGDRFEGARALVLGASGDADPTAAPGVIEAKAAGVALAVTRDRTYITNR
ncbi:MAG: hypothetical protein R2729_19505 [Bryobacteraceae bacterium]